MKQPIALLLSGGAGTRFKPFITKKPMYPFMGKPLLVHNLEMIKGIGLKQAIIVVSPPLKKELKNLKSPGLKLDIVVQSKAMGMADAVISAEKEINNRPVFIKNATDVIDPSFTQTLKQAINNQKPFVVGIKQSTYFPGGYLTLKNNILKNIVEKPGAGNEPSPWVNLVYHFFPQSALFLNYLKTSKTPNDDQYEVALNRFCQNSAVRMLPYQGPWQSLKYPWHVIEMAQLFLKESLSPKIHTTANVHPSAIINGPVFIGKNATILERAVINGPTYIGSNTLIGTGALIRNSLIEPNVEIGFASEIVRSYIGSGCKLHHVYVGDSALESNVYMGSGSKTANWRFESIT